MKLLLIFLLCWTVAAQGQKKDTLTYTVIANETFNRSGWGSVGYDSVSKDKRHSIQREIIGNNKLSDSLIITGDTLAVIRMLWTRLEQAEGREMYAWEQYGRLNREFEKTLKMWRKMANDLKATTGKKN